MFRGIELRPSGGALAQAVVAEALARDLWVYPAGSGPPVPDAVMLGPAFTITDVEVDALVERLTAAARRRRHPRLTDGPSEYLAASEYGMRAWPASRTPMQQCSDAPSSGAGAGQHERDAGAAERGVADLQPAAVGGRDVGRDGEAEAGTATVAGAALVEADEAPYDVAPPRPAGCPGRRRRRSRRTSPSVASTDVRTADVACRAALATRWSTARATAPRSPTTGSTSSPTVTSTGTRRARDPMSRATSAIENSVVANAALVAAGEQQQVVDETLQPIELGEQHVARRRPVDARAPAGPPPARRA